VKRKPKTYTTVECIVADIRRGSQDSGVKLLAKILKMRDADHKRENRKLRDALRPFVWAAYAVDDLEHDTMNPDYHLEITVSVAEARAANKALRMRFSLCARRRR